MYAPDFADNAAEVGAALARARAALPEGCPIFLLAESMGGPCALQHLLSDGVDSSAVNGIILCGALIQINPALMPPKVGPPFQCYFLQLPFQDCPLRRFGTVTESRRFPALATASGNMALHATLSNI